MATFKDFRNNVKPNWCPGCGDFSVQAAIQKAAANVGLEPEEVAIITGIGCSDAYQDTLIPMVCMEFMVEPYRLHKVLKWLIKI